MKFLLRNLYGFLMKKMSPEMRLKIIYYRMHREWPNFSNPMTFNEKVLRRLVRDKNPIYGQLADKFEVRKFIQTRIGEHVLIPLILATKNPEDLRRISSWKGIVIKANHGAGMTKIYDEEPETIEKNQAIKEMKEWLKIDYAKLHDEWHYSLIDPKIVVEKKITPKNKIPRDFKFHSFKQKDGSVNYLLQLVDGRFGVESRGYYLNSLDNCVWHHGNGNHLITESEKEQLLIAIEYNKKILGNEFQYIRIDWYVVENKIYFGELTFTPGGGRAKEFGDDLEKVMAKWWIDEPIY